MRIIADTNTLISGSLWSGNPGRLLDAVKAGKVVLLAMNSFEGIPIMKAREALVKLGLPTD